MNNTNLFKHAPKELSTDAFITWLLYFLDSNPEYKEQKQLFFNKLLLKSEDNDRPVRNIEIKRQSTNQHGRPDILLHFHFEEEKDKKQTILFENKTWSTTNHIQLDGYKKGYPNTYRYIYLKLAYVNHFEEKLTKSFFYDIITVHELSETLSRIKDIHPFVAHYLEYIDQTFKSFIDQIPENLFFIHDYSILGEEKGQAQQYLIDLIYKELDGKVEKLCFLNGSSSGRPWTQLTISEKPNIYGKLSEKVFWRVDIRSGKFYIRLNQYSYITDEFKSLKMERLNKLRIIANDILKEYPFLNIGNHLEKGIKESEIVIFFLEDNDLNELFRILPEFSIKFNEMYENSLF